LIRNVSPLPLIWDIGLWRSKWERQAVPVDAGIFKEDEPGEGGGWRRRDWMTGRRAIYAVDVRAGDRISLFGDCRLARIGI
jgi:hypothetical protein